MRILSLKSTLQLIQKSIFALLVVLKLLKFMTTENRQLRIYLFNLNIPILYLEKEGMLALVEKGFMSLMTFYLAITA